MKLFAISDLHVGYPQNREALERLSPRPDDWLILAGDLGETDEHLRFVFGTLGLKFGRLIWVPGNHELYAPLSDRSTPRGRDRYDHLVELCRQNTELMQLAMPSLRADFEAFDTYRYVDGPPLAVPVTVLAGRRDGALASHEAVAAWRERTTGRYAEHWIDAGHFFVDTHRPWVLARIAEALTGDGRAAGP